MQHDAAIAIVNKLGDSQIAFIKKIFHANNTGSLIELFDILIRNRHNEVEFKSISKALYQELYPMESTARYQEDLFLLLSKLNEALIRLVIEDELTSNELFKKKMLLLAFKNYNIDDLYTSNYEQTKEQAIKELAYDKALTIQLWTLEQGYNHKLRTLNSYEDKAEFFTNKTAETIELLENYMATVIRANQFYSTFIYHYKHNLLGMPAMKDELEFYPTIQLNDHTLSLCYYYRAIALNSTGKSRLNYFIKAYDVLKTYETKTTAIKELEINVLLNIGRSYQQMAEYNKAALYLQDAINFYSPVFEHYPSTEKLYANYIVSLLNLFEYEKALSVINQISEHSNTEQYIQHWFNIYRMMCFIGLRKKEAINLLMPGNLAEIPPQHRLYYRLMMSIELYMQKDIDLAIEEIQDILNNKQLFNYTNEALPVITFMESGYTVFKKRLSSEHFEEEEILESLIKKVNNQVINDINILPLYRWMKKELGINR